MQMDSNMIAAWAAVVASLTAILALIWQTGNSRFQIGVDMLFKLDDKYYMSTAMREARRKAAKGIKNGANEEIDDVLDFFEMIGLLVRRKALSELFVGTRFSILLTATVSWLSNTLHRVVRRTLQCGKILSGYTRG
jgi:hypothetical protein